MLRIRLTRVGKKGQPYYRVVVADAESKRDGRIVENIGHYNTLSKPSIFEIKEDRALYWLSVGAQPSDTVRNFLEKRGTMRRLARLRAGEPLEALVAEVQGVKESAQPVAKKAKAAPAPAPVAEAESVVEMEAVEPPVAEAESVVEMEAVEPPFAEAESVVELEAAEQPFAGDVPVVEEPAGETVVEEPANEVGEAYAGAESAVEIEVAEAGEAAAETAEEGEGFFARVRDVVGDAAEVVGDAASGAVGAVREAIEDVFEGDEEE